MKNPRSYSNRTLSSHGKLNRLLSYCCRQKGNILRRAHSALEKHLCNTSECHNRHLFHLLLDFFFPFFFFSSSVYRKKKKKYIYIFILSCLSQFWLFSTSWTVACLAPLSMRFSRQEYWSALPCFPPRDHPNPGIEPISFMPPALVGRFFTTGTT